MKSVCVWYLRLHLLMHMDLLSLGTDSVREGKDVPDSLGILSKTRSQLGLHPHVPTTLQSTEDYGWPFAYQLGAELIHAVG